MRPDRGKPVFGADWISVDFLDTSPSNGVSKKRQEPIAQQPDPPENGTLGVAAWTRNWATGEFFVKNETDQLAAEQNKLLNPVLYAFFQ